MTEIKLIDNWRKWHKMWSMRLAGLASTALMVIIAQPSIITDTLNSLPPEARAWISPFVGFIMFGIIWLLRMIDQVKKEEISDAAATAKLVVAVPKDPDTTTAAPARPIDQSEG